MLALITFLSLLMYISNLEDKNFWFEKGKTELDDALQIKWNNGVAKNVILFIGDGMGPNTITAARIYKNQENSSLFFENFPHIGLMKTYAVDKQVPDSASTATALFSGVKTNFETVGVDAAVKLDDCKTSLDVKHRLRNIVNWAHESRKDTGFVTTTRVTHATPSALYAHCPNRRWECDAKVPNAAEACKDIARQLVEDEPGKSIKVIMGGGRQCLITNSTTSNDDPRDTWACSRKDGRNLVNQWIKHKKENGLSYKYLTSTSDLYNLNTEQLDYVMGIFANGHMKMDYERNKSPSGMPSLSQMTEASLNILIKNKEGFLLVVEGGLIDYAHHRGFARVAVDETIAFEMAIQSAVNLLKARGVLDSTLIIVTSDHSHSLAITGRPPRGNNILGIAEHSKIDGVPFTTLLYATGGKGNIQYEFKSGNVSRRDPSTENTTAFQYYQQAAVHTEEVLHDGGDVAVYAMGKKITTRTNENETWKPATIIASHSTYLDRMYMLLNEHGNIIRRNECHIHKSYGKCNVKPQVSNNIVPHQNAIPISR